MTPYQIGRTYGTYINITQYNKICKKTTVPEKTQGFLFLNQKFIKRKERFAMMQRVDVSCMPVQYTSQRCNNVQVHLENCVTFIQDMSVLVYYMTIKFSSI